MNQIRAVYNVLIAFNVLALNCHFIPGRKIKPLSGNRKQTTCFQKNQTMKNNALIVHLSGDEYASYFVIACKENALNK